jgi:DNA-binding LytR/AlgR family response regulator
MPISALIAEDEPLLAQALQRELALLWPGLQTQLASDGLQAVSKALEQLPDILFFDVRMPGLSGLEAVQEITERWPAQRKLPALVFVTAYDEYAVKAFEHAALDYIVKPVKTLRLQQCLERIRPPALMEYTQSATELIAHEALHQAAKPSVNADRDQQAFGEERLLISLRALLRSPLASAQAFAAPERLLRIQASVGNQIVMLPIQEVAYFEAADKYVRVLTGVNAYSRELLIRTPIKDLLPQLDPQEFWQIHRATVVRASLIETVQRDETGKLSLQLRGFAEKLAISRLYAPQFKAM